MIDGESFRTVNIHQTRNEKNRPLFKTNIISTTKYNLLTFLPKNLFEQFSRIANFYFLVSILLMLCPGVSISPITAAFPLFIVVGISAIREAIEDFLRYRSDKKINKSISHVLKDGSFVDIAWEDVLVGDVIKVEKDEQIPADIVLLSSDNDEGVACIDTCNLDGETNLKIRQAILETSELGDDPFKIQNFNATIKCDEPNNLLYTLNGCLEHNGNSFPLDNQQVILRGCMLRNTKFAIGAVIYTGVESKLMMNSSTARTKKSNLERGLNVKLISVFIFQLVLTLVCSGIGLHFKKENVYSHKYWYFYQSNDTKEYNDFVTFLLLYVAHFVIINMMIPISLYVTLEVVRVFQAIFVAWDGQMFDLESNMNAQARTTNISDDLGQIEYIFSDKTGTLTRNVMEFMKCSIAGNVYGRGITEVAYSAAKRRGIDLPPPDNSGKAFKDDNFMNIIKNNPPKEIMHFLWLLGICHSVIPEKDPTKPYGIAFQASSPDEAALVSAAADFGYIFKEKGQNEATICVNGCDYKVPILAILEFSSQRKRSSVIIRHPITNEIVLYCKGADDLIMKRLAPGSKYVNETSSHLKQFAADGLRTLCCAYRVIDESFFESWSNRYNEACCKIQGRDEAVEAVSNEIECNLQILGATAIEDKLQAEVSDTIQSLLLAQINVWIITGDKKETAINIGFACSLLASDMQLVILDSEDPEELEQIVRDALSTPSERRLALVANGSSLYYLLQEKNSDLFLTLTKRCKSVICCRVSPLQKKMVVSTIRNKTGAITLAIGDGANDVGMILEADVGVGISGKEGRQAVLAADYSFGQFRFLKKLLLFHGRCNFYRNVDLINYSFYKNMMFAFNQLLFAFFCGFSGTSLYNSWLLSIVNVVFTSVPIVVYSAMERDVAQNSMLQIPELYYFDGKRKWILSSTRFWLSLFLGILHSFACFLIPYFGMQPFTKSNGKVLGLSDFGVTVFGCAVFIANLKIATMCTYWTWIHHLSIWGSILIFFPITLVLSTFDFSQDLKTVTDLMSHPNFYMSIVSTSIVALLPVVAFDAISNSFNNITNRVLSWERSPIKSKPVRQEVSVFIPPPPPITDTGAYVDTTNATGYLYDEPPSYEKTRFETNINMRNRIKNTDIQAPSEFNYRSVNFIPRTKAISQFSLDNL